VGQLPKKEKKLRHALVFFALPHYAAIVPFWPPESESSHPKVDP
jgi:hypothetical protein